MSVGRKAKPEKSLAPSPPGKIPEHPAVARDANAAPHPESSGKSGKPERVEFAQGTYYRQGVLVPGGPHAKNPMARGRNR